eukprot:355276-Lingulodinium_polyedra.AAC.1
MKASHKASLKCAGPSSTSSGFVHWRDTGPQPVMGPDVMATNLWEVRDIWEWLSPGRSVNTEEATTRGGM